MNRAQRILSQTDADTIVVMNGTLIDLSFFYVTGFSTGLFEGCAALITRDGMEIVVSALEEESAKEGGFPLAVFSTKDEREKLLKEKLACAKRIGVNASELTYQNYLTLKECAPQADVVDVSEAVKKARGVKDQEEVRRIARACRVASKVADTIPELLHEGMRESELAAEINYLMQKGGASGPSFPPIVAFGKNAALPHYQGGEVKLKRGDFVLCDFGAEHKRYVSDITRTCIFKKSSERQVRIYNHVLESQKIALTMIRSGVEARAPHLAVKEFIEKNYEEGFIHGLGHSIGMGVHDGMGMRADATFTLETGMVFTVEPGIYVPGYGGVRIEDNIVVTDDGYKMLTTAKRSLQIAK
jgi:Xaa-Pro dipeptidase